MGFFIFLFLSECILCFGSNKPVMLNKEVNFLKLLLLLLLLLLLIMTSHIFFLILLACLHQTMSKRPYRSGLGKIYGTTTFVWNKISPIIIFKCAS